MSMGRRGLAFTAPSAELIVGHRRPGLRCEEHRDWTQRSLIFVYVGLEQWPISVYISPIDDAGVKS
jgi:hypothetical protein